MHTNTYIRPAGFQVVFLTDARLEVQKIYPYYATLQSPTLQSPTKTAAVTFRVALPRIIRNSRLYGRGCLGCESNRHWPLTQTIGPRLETVGNNKISLRSTTVRWEKIWEQLATTALNYSKLECNLACSGDRWRTQSISWCNGSNVMENTEWRTNLMESMAEAGKEEKRLADWVMHKHSYNRERELLYIGVRNKYCALHWKCTWSAGMETVPLFFKVLGTMPANVIAQVLKSLLTDGNGSARCAIRREPDSLMLWLLLRNEKNQLSVRVHVYLLVINYGLQLQNDATRYTSGAMRLPICWMHISNQGTVVLGYSKIWVWTFSQKTSHRHKIL